MLNMYEVSKSIAMGKTIFELNLRVVYYLRVSSLRDAQLNSLENQESFFKDYVKRFPNWTITGCYVDTGIRGESVEKREEFRRMIEDSKNDKFDLILTKEVSRFARNTLDSLKYTRELFRHNVGVYFINDNICTLNGDGELRLTIMSSIYQDEVRKLSSRIKFGDKESMKKGVVFGNSRIYGYDKANGKLVINKPEAEMVKKIYNWYVNEDCSASKIEDLLYADGYRSRAGGKIAHTTINSILRNPKYKGYYCGHKVEIEDYMTQKQRFLPKEEWILWKDEKGDTVPQIIDEQLWELAGQKLKKSSELVKNRVANGYNRELWGASPLSHKIYCTHCNKSYWRDTITIRKEDVEIKELWKCSGKKKNGAKSCNSVALYLKDIELILKDVSDNISNINDELLDEFMDMVKSSIDSSSDNEKKIKELQMSIKKSEKKKELLLELYVEENINKEDYLNQVNEINETIKKNTSIIENYENTQQDLLDVQKRLNNIRKAMNDLKEKEDYNIQTILPFINKINVGTPNEKNEIDVEVVLFDGTSRSSKYHTKSSGHIFKKMIEAYENSMK